MSRRRHGTHGQHQGKTRHGSGRLRLIGGRFRRRLLPVPDHPGLRPTPDRVRETLFNWLALEIDGRTRVLDLFSGTGALGLEALSRGAGEVHFVEADRLVARQITQNLTSLDVMMPVHHQRADAFLDTRPVQPFNLVFVDPPFRQDLISDCCQRLEEEGWLAEGALIHVETEAGLMPRLPDGWHLTRDTRAGDSHVRLYRREKA